jgi:hypothetical protein
MRARATERSATARGGHQSRVLGEAKSRRTLPNAPVRALAARVLTAIRDDDLYVFTHPEMRVAAEERFAAILAAMDKAGR